MRRDPTRPPVSISNLVRLPWVGAVIAVLNCLAAQTIVYVSRRGESSYSDPPVVGIWIFYAGVAIVVAGLVAWYRPGVALAIALVLLVLTLLTPFFVGLWMLPSAVAAVVVAARGLVTLPDPVPRRWPRGASHRERRDA